MTTRTQAEIEQLVVRCLAANGADAANAAATARTVAAAERDGAESHGLFRVPGYVASLRSGKINGAAQPTHEHLTGAAIRVDGDHGMAPLALEYGVPLLADAAGESGIAVLMIRNSFHFAALWPEVEALAEREFVGIACTAHTPMVAPFGGDRAFFSTNPIAFAYPRPGHRPVVFDMATSAMARGDVGVAAMRGDEVPPGTGLDASGTPTTDAAKIIDGGVLLPFGGYKGSLLATMIELLAAGVVGDHFSYEAADVDNGDGGPAIGGELLIAMSPAVLSGGDWAAHVDAFVDQLTAIPGVRLPSQRRFDARDARDGGGPIPVDAALLAAVEALCDPANPPT